MTKHNPTPPNPLPSKFIWEEAKNHYDKTLKKGFTRAEYSKAALLEFLDIVEAACAKLDLAKSLLWPVYTYSLKHRRWIEIFEGQDPSSVYFALESLMHRAEYIIKKAQEEDSFFKASDLKNLIEKYQRDNAELCFFIEEYLPYDRESHKWWASSIDKSLNGLSRNMLEHFQSDGEYYEPPFYIHKCLVIMAIHREDVEAFDEWLDWEDEQAFQEASKNLTLFLEKLDKRLSELSE